MASRSLARNAKGPTWTCYVEPLTTAGLPGAAHLRVLALADLYSRFKAMQGFRVNAGHGWACHGLGVEIAVASELGLAGRAEVEAYGVEAFAARCRESALRHAGVFASLSERIGGLADPNRAYRTMDRGYIESVWWSLRQFFDAKMLFPDQRIAQYCPRCQTTLADHELRGPGVYQPVTGTAVLVRLGLDRLAARAAPRLPSADLLVWMPEPWTLTGNVAVAVHPDETYVIGRRAGHDDRVIVAEQAFTRALGEGWHIASRITGAELAGATYRPAFRLLKAGAYQVLADRSVDAGRGTGLLPVTPAFGGGQAVAEELPVVDPIGADGRFDQTVPVLSGLRYTDAESVIVTYLSDRGLLFSARPNPHRRPHCWRCGARLLGRLSSSWYLGLSGVTARLLASSERVAWHPAGARPPGEAWLSADWAVSRTRYWGVPLPIWKCVQGHLTCVSSLTELSELAGRDLLGLDPHRPVIDRIEIVCRACGGQARRVPDIIDAAYDTGAMPFARHGAPMRHQADFDARVPADLLIAGDAQIRSWHFALLAIGSLVLGRTPLRAALRCGDVLDVHGRPMNRRHGNLKAPFPLIERNGADAVRWFFASVARPDAPVTVTDAGICAVTGRVLRKYLNCAVLYSRYAEVAGARELMPPAVAAGGRVLDRWLLSELQSTIAEVTAALDSYRPDAATRRIERFIDDLSTWYVRRSRDRIAGHAGHGPQGAALAAMRTALDVVSRLMAPFTPFVSDHVWHLIRGCDAPDSVHLARWPQAEAPLADDRLRRQMRLVRRIARAGRAARAMASIGLRQPLARARVGVCGFSALDPDLVALVAQELNVRSIEPVRADWEVATGRAGCVVVLDVAVTRELRLEGLARQATRVIQEGRRAAGFGLGEPITVGWQSPDDEVAAALADFGQLISQRVRATKYERALTGGADAFEYADANLAATFWLRPLLPPSPAPASSYRPA